MVSLVAALLVLTCCLECQYSKKPRKVKVPVPEHLDAYRADELLETVKADGYEGGHPESVRAFPFPDRGRFSFCRDRRGWAPAWIMKRLAP